MKARLIKLPKWLNTEGLQVGQIYTVRNICISVQEHEVAYVEMRGVRRGVRSSHGAIAPEHNSGMRDITYTKELPGEMISSDNTIPDCYYVSSECLMYFDDLILDNDGGLVYLNQIDETVC